MKWHEDDVLERIGYDFYCDIANRIVKARKRKEYTQEELAKKTGIKWAKIASAEQVRVKLKLKELEVISKALDVTVEWLVGADPDTQVGKCLYLIWGEDWGDLKLYQAATSKRMAFLLLEKRINEAGVSIGSSRERFFVKLTGVPLTDREIRYRFPKLAEEDEEIFPDEKRR